MQCPACEAVCEEEAAFCHQCGARLLPEEPGADNPESAAAPTSKPHDPFHRVAPGGGVPDDNDDAEEPIWDGAYSSKAMIGQWIAAAVATVLAVVVGVLTETWLILLGLAALVWVGMFAWYAYRRFSVHYTLSTQRLIHESGILWRTIDRIELIDIDDVTFKQGPVERAFRVGTIIVISGDKTSPTLNLPGIDNVRSVADKIDDARRKERRRRGLHMITQGA